MGPTSHRVGALFALTTSASICAAPVAIAQTYPSANVRMLVPFAPGGTMDIVARIVAERLAERLGGVFIVDNRPGAGGTLATDLLAKSAPTGHTLMAFHSGLAYNAALYPALPFDTLKDIAPVSQVGTTPSVLVVGPSFKAQTTKEAIAAARAAPGTINYSSAGSGSTTHLAIELFASLTGTKLQHVPYKGGAPAMLAVVSGEAQLMIATLPGALPHLKSGRLRALGVTSLKRSPVLLDVPTLAESGVPGYEYETWYGVFAPAGTPRDVVGALNKAINQSLSAPEMQAQMGKQGIDPVGGSAEHFSALVRREIVKWTKLIKDAGIRIE